MHKFSWHFVFFHLIFVDIYILYKYVWSLFSLIGMSLSSRPTWFLSLTQMEWDFHNFSYNSFYVKISWIVDEIPTVVSSTQ